MSNATNKESVGRTLLVAFSVSLVAAIFVAGAAVTLKPIQIENRALDKQRSILSIAGLGQGKMTSNDVRTLFSERVSARVVDLDTGEYVDEFDPATFDPLKAAKDPNLSEQVSTGDDLASIKRRERYTTIYMVQQNGRLETLVLPVRGYGLWSTLHGFIALKSDLNTVAGFGFYEHGETPGLGGEVDNPRWLAQWPGKQMFDANGKPVLHIVKGGVDPGAPGAIHQVDGLAGATLTSKGVDNLLQFWLGEQGFGPYLARLRSKGV